MQVSIECISRLCGSKRELCTRFVAPSRISGLGAHSAPASRGPQRAVFARWGRRSGAGHGAPASDEPGCGAPNAAAALGTPVWGRAPRESSLRAPSVRATVLRNGVTCPLRTFLLTAAVILRASCLRAQEREPPQSIIEFKKLSVQELMDIEVTSVSKSVE